MSAKLANKSSENRCEERQKGLNISNPDKPLKVIPKGHVQLDTVNKFAWGIVWKLRNSYFNNKSAPAHKPPLAAQFWLEENLSIVSAYKNPMLFPVVLLNDHPQSHYHAHNAHDLS